MAEPPSKRARRTDSSAMWEEDTKSASSRTERERPSKASEVNGERHDRDRRDGRRDRERDRERGHKDERSNDHKPRDREERDRDRRRERSRSKDRSRKDDARQRSRSPHKESRSSTGRTRSPPRGPRSDHNRHRYPPDRKGTPTNGPSQPSSRPLGRVKKEEDKDIKMEDGLDDLDDEARMLKIMGFGGFRSTKNTKVPGNDKNFGVRKEKKSMYRQYMNRQGGFNRPLSPS